MATVAVVVGNDENRMLLRGLLRLHHHSVVYEGNHADAAQVKAPAPRPDILLLDVDAPTGDWLSVQRAWRDRVPGLRTVLVTPRQIPDIERRARENGVGAILVRPFQISRFLEVLQPSPPVG